MCIMHALQQLVAQSFPIIGPCFRRSSKFRCHHYHHHHVGEIQLFSYNFQVKITAEAAIRRFVLSYLYLLRDLEICNCIGKCEAGRNVSDNSSESCIHRLLKCVFSSLKHLLRARSVNLNLRRGCTFSSAKTEALNSQNKTVSRDGYWARRTFLVDYCKYVRNGRKRRYVTIQISKRLKV